MNESPPRPAPLLPPLLPSLSAIADNYDVILCDVWGVIHNGVASFAKATDALTRFRRQGGKVVLITNAPRPSEKVRAFLDQLAVSRESYDQIVSSGDVTVSLILERGGQALAHIGPPQDRSLFDVAERQSCRKLRFAGLADADFVVCTGLDDADREIPTDYRPRLDIMRRRALTMICANPDIVVEVGDRLVYCAGALAEAYQAIGGPVIQAGKSYPPIYHRALTEAAQALGVAPAALDKKRVLAIGDAMHTDIKGAQAMALATLFVTSGIHRAQLHGGAETPQRAAAAFHQFFEDTGFAPSFATAELAW
ncbi:MAG: TIGR01459 family HAD-type hydrolase [Methylovirgula sp.]|jgi:HAD superfamily hydrolase (TIGR01459 family)